MTDPIRRVFLLHPVLIHMNHPLPQRPRNPPRHFVALLALILGGALAWPVHAQEVPDEREATPAASPEVEPVSPPEPEPVAAPATEPAAPGETSPAPEAAADVLPLPEVEEAVPTPAVEVEAEAVAPEEPASPALEPVATPPAPPLPEAPPEPVHRREIITIGGPSHLLANETAQEMVTIMGNAIVDGHVRGECVTILGSVTINGRVDGEVVCVGGTVTLGPNAEVDGEVVCVGGTISAAPGAVIRGERVEVPIFGGLSLPSFEWLGQWFTEGLMFGRPLPHQHTWAWAVAGVLLIINLLFYLVFRRAIDASVSALAAKPAMAFVHGLLLFILFGPLVLLLLVSVVGIIVVPFVVAGVFLAGFAGLIAVYCFAGGQLGLQAQPVLALVAGNVLFVLLYAVPFVGLAVLIIASLLGLGCVLSSLFESMRREARGGRTKRPAVVPSPGTSSPVAQAAAVGQSGGVSASVSGDPAVAAAAFVEGAIPADTGPSHPPPMLPPAIQPRATALVLAQLERTGFWPRLGASAIDFLIVAPLSIWISSMFWWFPGDTPAFPVLWLFYHIGFWAWKSTTIGGHVLNLRIMRLDHGKVDIGTAVVRALGAILSFLPLGIGFMWASWDNERQSWHDKIAGTTIARVPPGQSLF